MATILHCVSQVTYLAFIGGEDEKDTVNKIMSAVIGNELAKLYNWHGKKKKKSFKDLQLAKAVYCKWHQCPFICS